MTPEPEVICVCCKAILAPAERYYRWIKGEFGPPLCAKCLYEWKGEAECPRR